MQRLRRKLTRTEPHLEVQALGAPGSHACGTKPQAWKDQPSLLYARLRCARRRRINLVCDCPQVNEHRFVEGDVLGERAAVRSRQVEVLAAELGDAFGVLGLLGCDGRVLPPLLFEEIRLLPDIAD